VWAPTRSKRLILEGTSFISAILKPLGENILEKFKNLSLQLKRKLNMQIFHQN
jgi:hypothetical protein